jgi:iron-sulfur cluster repair protein YtfE (RIC family)
MTQSLPQVGHEHHERIQHVVNQMPEIGDLLLSGPAAEITLRIDELYTFLTGTLVPHVDAAEQTLYPELERMMQNMHSMAPMKREHKEVRRLVAEFGKLRPEVTGGRITIGRAVAMRRVIYQLYALLKMHLAEEEMYLRIVEHGVTSDVADMLAAAMEHPGIPAS